MNLEETLDKIAELSREELGIVRKRGEEKTAAREHGHDYTHYGAAEPVFGGFADTSKHVSNVEMMRV